MRAASESLLTDLYQLSMMQAYFEHGMTQSASFEFFVRHLPPTRSFLLAAGLDQALDFCAGIHFEPPELEWLAGCGQFSRAFVDQLAEFRFTGDVDAMPEGTVFFADEPILRVTAPLPVAQFLETRLINLLHFQTVIASKAARMVLAAPGKRLIDFGFRRAHGAEAGMLAARAAYIAGFAGTATVEAGRRFGIPAFGTMAHSFVQAHDSEAEAFVRFGRARPERLVLLLDTYDTEAAARTVVRIAPQLAAEGIHIAGVRLDSGDLDALARRVRSILDQAGLSEITILASGGLDEYELARLHAAGAPIDGYGIGTSLTTASDAPALDCAYKLQVYAGLARRKRSTGKATWPGAKQVFRRYDADGRMSGDMLALHGDACDGEALLEPVMRAGRRLGPPPSLDAIRARVAQQLARLPQYLRGLGKAKPYTVEVSASLRELAAEVDRRTAG